MLNYAFKLYTDLWRGQQRSSPMTYIWPQWAAGGDTQWVAAMHCAHFQRAAEDSFQKKIHNKMQEKLV